MIINHNLSALNANNQLNRNDSKMARSLERLTSGLKINSAADDAAGMAISQKMKSQIQGLEKASGNAADGISVIQTAEGALQEVESCLQRMRELSVQAANEINTLEDREAIQQEINALNEEINRISKTTEFNTKNLLDGSVDRKKYIDNAALKVISVSDEVASGDYHIKVTQDARQAVIVGAAMDVPSPDPGVITKSQIGNVIVNGESIEINEGDTYEQVYAKIKTKAEDTGAICFMIESNATPETTYDPSKDLSRSEFDEELREYAGYKPQKWDFTNDKAMVFISKDLGSNAEVSVSCDNDELGKLLGISSSMLVENGKDAKVEIESTNGSSFSENVTVTSSGDRITMTDFCDFEIQIKVDLGTVGTKFKDAVISDRENGVLDGATITEEHEIESKVTVLDAGALSLHIGANAYQTMNISIKKVDAEVLGVDNVNVTTTKGAQSAIEASTKAIRDVSSLRAKLGAYENRLEHSIANLDTANENMTESLSRIEDADMAQEMTGYTQYSVLVQAGTSMLAQANQRPQNILSLLQ